MQNAAERLLGLKLTEIQELAKDIIFGQLRLVVATMDIEEINTDRDKFLEAVSRNVETELKKIGLRLINVNVTDITDESGYIEALGREAAAKAINDAKKSVAEKNRDGSIGEANASRDERIQVAAANSEAIKGENEAQADIAQSNAILRERQAEALKRATSAERIQKAKALEEAYAAEQKRTCPPTVKRLPRADILVKSEIEKRRIELRPKQGQRKRRLAKGEADAIFMKMEARARGMQELLISRLRALHSLCAAGGNAADATRMMLADKMEDLMSIRLRPSRTSRSIR